MNLKFRQLPGTFSVCRLAADAPIPEWTANAPFAASFVSITRTADELSIVCPASHAPKNAECETPWTCFKLEGPFPFAQTGVLASFIDPLAAKGIPIFAVSTFDTDYVLVKEEFALSALQTLQAAGHELLS
ncbi:MAG: ACT domain-containing protein [Terriglobales bacterium]